MRPDALSLDGLPSGKANFKMELVSQIKKYSKSFMLLDCPTWKSLWIRVPVPWDLSFNNKR
jgi:hypothetical protein